MTAIGLTRRKKRRKLQNHLASTKGLYDNDVFVENNSISLVNAWENGDVVPESDFSDHSNIDVNSGKSERESGINGSDFDPLSESDGEYYVEENVEVTDIFYDCKFQDDSDVFLNCAGNVVVPC
ncbi:hypothetical protein OUZ56_016710 [Daphnia magna]|uniref:Uncharacterized protein n=1 Tax=Daphnia magna TaxID=35525 RepID=A0ABR0ARB4_9CRUS|nr:hypothetical protein OUZ56_016710 [Daphnia magna]